MSDCLCRNQEYYYKYRRPQKNADMTVIPRQLEQDRSLASNKYLITDEVFFRGYYKKLNGSCIDCPANANCTSLEEPQTRLPRGKQGLSQHEIFAQRGAWRVFWNDTIFLNCSNGYSGANAWKVAASRCCPDARHCSAIKEVYLDNYTQLNESSLRWRPKIQKNEKFRDWQKRWRDAQCLCNASECYSGPMCMICGNRWYEGKLVTNYVRSPISGKCELCPDGAPEFSLALGALMFVCLVISCAVCVLIRGFRFDKDEADGFQEDREGEASEILDQISIMISFAQILSSVTLTFDSVLWPRKFASFSRTISFVDIDLSTYLPIVGCKLSISSLERFALHLLTPLAIIGAIKFAQVLVRLTSKSSKSDASQTIKITVVADKCIVILISLIYPGTCRRIFQVFRCNHMREEGEYLLFDEIRFYYDYSVECWTGKHLIATAFATLGVIFFALGVPLALMFGMWNNRSSLHNLSHPKHLDTLFRYGFLYTSYEPEYWWWEIVIMVQKCLLTSVLVILFPGTPFQLFLALLVSTSYMAVVLRAGPYVGNHEDVLSFLATISISVTMLAGLAKITDTNARDTAKLDGLVSENALGDFLIVVNLPPLFYFVIVNATRIVCHRQLKTRRLERSKMRKIEHSRLKLVPFGTTRGPYPSHVSLSICETKSDVDCADEVLRNYQESEISIAKTHAIRRQKSIQKTQMRIAARTKVKSSRALTQVPAFSHLSEGIIGKIVDQMSLEFFEAGSILCREGDLADRMFIIVSGTCNVTSTKAQKLKIANPIAKLSVFDIVGESMMRDNPQMRVRNATVVANASVEISPNQIHDKKHAKSGVQTLVLLRSKYELLVRSKIITDAVVKTVRSIDTSRRNNNLDNFARFYEESNAKQ